jgi:ferredoxin-nitrate reductase
MHWGKILSSDLNRANNVTNNLVDPISKEPDFKFSAVEVARYQKPKQKIVIIGAGAGAFGFVKSYRALNKVDEIEIFSKEDHPFYNRVLLPDYINGAQNWQQLIKMKDQEELDLGIKLHRGLSVENINRQNNIILDNKGRKHSYDKLIIATGSRAATIKDMPKMGGIFTMRTRNDADDFINYLDQKN